MPVLCSLAARRSSQTGSASYGLCATTCLLTCIAEVIGITHQAAWEWKHRVLATVDGHQNRIVLKDRVWIGEAYLNDMDLAYSYRQAEQRRLSRQLLCISVAIDIRKNSAVVCGYGKFSTQGG